MNEQILRKNVGKCLLAFDLVSGCSPCMETIVALGDPEIIEEALNHGLSMLIEKHLGKDVCFYLGAPMFKIHPRTGIIKSPEERSKELEDSRSLIREAIEDSLIKHSESLRNHPKNGTLGFWRVSGTRNNAIVTTDHAIKAVKLASNIVGDWECPDAEFIGEVLPEVFEV